MNISLPKEFEDYVAAQVESGAFASATEVVVDALQRQRMERGINAGLAGARSQVAKGAVTEATADFFEQARERIRRHTR
jgi:putative addiction module CopG family antidote